MIPVETLQRILDVGVSQTAIKQHEHGDPFVVVPQGYKVENLKGLVPPRKIESVVDLTDPKSFVDYVNRFKEDETMIFAAVSDIGARFHAVFDYHEAPVILEGGSAIRVAQPGELSHWATFSLQSTTEWKRWCEANGKHMDQSTFAVWLEDNQDLLVDPTGADLLELVTTLEGKNDVRFVSSMRLNSGKNALQYEEDAALAGTGTRIGKVEIPQQIQAGIKPFQGVAAYALRARLKYRINQRKVEFWFETIAMHRTVRDAIQGVIDTIVSGTAITPLAGVLVR